MIISFAEFERQVISERTADKMAATRRKGMWTGGVPMLGYDLKDKKLVVNEDEATLVRKIYEMYLELGSLKAVVVELNRRGWTTKSYSTQGGKLVPGKPFDNNTINRILRSPLYIGKVQYQGEMYDGVQDAILAKDIWNAVQARLDEQNRTAGRDSRNKHGALLKNLIRCKVCGAEFGYHYSNRHGKHYSYYVCQTTLHKGASKCPGSRVSAVKLEQVVIEKIQAIGSDPHLVKATVAALKKNISGKAPEFTTEIKRLNQELKRYQQQRKNLLAVIAQGGDGSQALLQEVAEIDAAMQKSKKLLTQAQADLEALKTSTINENDVQGALDSFTPIWDELFPREQERIIRLLIESIAVNVRAGEMEIQFRASGIKTLATESADAEEVAA